MINARALSPRKFEEMKATTTQRMKTLRGLAALIVAVWMTGAGCFVCCGAVEASSHEVGRHVVAATIVVTAEASRNTQAATQADHSCCKAKLSFDDGPARDTEDAGRATVATSTSSTVVSEIETDETSDPMAAPSRSGRAHGCCERSTQTLDTARQPNRPAQKSHAALSTRTRTAGDEAAQFAAPLPPIRARLPDHSETYLRACIFLI